MKKRTFYNEKQILRWARNTPSTSLRSYIPKDNLVWGNRVCYMSMKNYTSKVIEHVNICLAAGVKRSKGSRKFYWETNKKN